MEKLTSYLPQTSRVEMDFTYLSDIDLADPSFASPGYIDIIIGAEIYPIILQQGLIKGPEGAPVAQETTLGWIVTGPISSSRSAQLQAHSTMINLNC